MKRARTVVHDAGSFARNAAQNPGVHDDARTAVVLVSAVSVTPVFFTLLTVTRATGHGLRVFVPLDLVAAPLGCREETKLAEKRRSSYAGNARCYGTTTEYLSFRLPTSNHINLSIAKIKASELISCCRRHGAFFESSARKRECMASRSIVNASRGFGAMLSPAERKSNRSLGGLTQKPTVAPFLPPPSLGGRNLP